MLKILQIVFWSYIMKTTDKLKRKISLFLINHFFSTTKFFALKRYLFKIANIKVGKETKVVGPFYCGTEVKIEIGSNCWIGKNFKVEGNGKIIIGNNCDFAPSVMVITGSHKIGNNKRRAGEGTIESIIIEEGCWIGARCTLLGTIVVHKMSIIGAMSFVNKNIVENSVVAGVPCKVIKYINVEDQ